MTGRLIKNYYGFQYTLLNEKGEVIATSENKKLSIKNCQAIENGYDLDELAKEASDGLIENHIWAMSMTFFKAGFQKALEILGDKKFSEFDIIKSFEYGWNQRHFDKTDEDELREIQKRFIQSLQQTEWDVEIEMEYHPTFNIFKLDADDCLILKRK